MLGMEWCRAHRSVTDTVHEEEVLKLKRGWNCKISQCHQCYRVRIKLNQTERIVSSPSEA
jgi:hypothetical protein